MTSPTPKPEAPPKLKDNTTTTSFQTRTLSVPPGPLGTWKDNTLQTWLPPPSPPSALVTATTHLLTSPIPVAFPTETVYGLGADATNASSVRGIYLAKGRPSDNPLIIHISDLDMLSSLLAPAPIPEIYLPLIEKFWPGPLTILLPLPSPSPLAAEVTAGLGTFGVRMPDSELARSLIKMAGRPLAAPSANASTRPSPTTAGHVLEDLRGRVEVIVDGGVCEVGVESTVVSGLGGERVVLRPGGVSLEELRAIPGWEGTVRGYGDGVLGAGEQPRAPGMKYKHYSPRARVVLFEHGGKVEAFGEGETVGLIRAGGWEAGCGMGVVFEREVEGDGEILVKEGRLGERRVLDVGLGGDVKGVAHGLFAALRELDRLGADVIYVEGVDDKGEDIAAAVMNRLRKAASEIRA
ncbi:hypothetical protein OQA88_3756 [Cercophora sp. LCS_1]